MKTFTICCLHQVVLGPLNLEQKKHDFSLYGEIRSKTIKHKLLVEQREEEIIILKV